MERILMCGLIASATAMGPVEAAARTWQEQSVQEIPAAGIDGLRVENTRGVVTVRPGADDDRIHLKAIKVVRSNDREWADRVSRGTRVTMTREAGELVVRVRYPQRQTVRVHFWNLFDDDFDLPRVEVRLALEVPRDLPIHLKSASGDLETSDLEAEQVLETTSGDVVALSGRFVVVSSTSGDVRLEDAGRARLRTVSGDVEVMSVAGPLDASTSSGDLVVRGARDSLRLRSVSGDLQVERAPVGIRAVSASGTIRVRGASGTVAIETANGDVSTDLVGPLRRADIETASGTIGVKLVGRLGCRLDIQSSHGEIELELPLDVRNVNRHRVTASVRDGTAPVVLRSTSGDITVTEASR